MRYGKEEKQQGEIFHRFAMESKSKGCQEEDTSLVDELKKKLEYQGIDSFCPIIPDTSLERRKRVDEAHIVMAFLLVSAPIG